MSSSPTSAAPVAANSFLVGSIPALFFKTTLPIVLVTSVNGLLTVIDAILLGSFVGPEALSAVTLMFPLSMLLVAASTTVGIGMASVMGRQLGADRLSDARRTFAGAHGLAITLALGVILLFALGGQSVTTWAAGGNAELAAMGQTFLGISIYTSPLAFLLAVQADALRAEDRVGFMALIGVLVTVANIGFNIWLIVGAGLGVAGSAWGTALAQALALLIVVVYRSRGGGRLTLSAADVGHITHGWKDLLVLGAPRSLTFIGLSLGSAAVLYALARLDLADHAGTIAAYGVVMRIMTFGFLPMLGMSLALQTLVGNNFGAGLRQRAEAILRLAMVSAGIYGLVVEIALLLGRDVVGGLFVDDPQVIAHVGRILPLYVALYFCFGPVMMIAAYFQAIGDAGRAALLSLAKTYLFAIPLTLTLPLAAGETGVWAAAPLAELLMLGLTIIVLIQARRGSGKAPSSIAAAT